MMTYFTGIDIGSAFTKIVIINNKLSTQGYGVIRTGIDFNKNVYELFAQILDKFKINRSKIEKIVATGVGRHSCELTEDTKPEIGCFAKGSFFLCGGPATVIDIGGQDNKIIKLDESGKQLFFRMNRKCAAGTGSFLEEIALKLNLKTSEMNEMAQKTQSTIPIGSFCTVFASTEIIHHLRLQENPEALMRGVYESVVKRVIEMSSIEHKAILTGGAIESNPILIELFKEKLKLPVEVPIHPQLVGALGAALFAEMKEEKE